MRLPDPDQEMFDPPYETMRRADLAALQEERLVDTIAHAYEHSALVRSTWETAGITPRDVRSVDDFRERAPFVDKDAIRHFRDEHRDPYGGLLCVPASELTAIMSTSGTTGDPTLVPEVWGGGSVDPEHPAIMYRDFWAMGVRPGDHVSLVLFTFRGPVYGFVAQLGCVPVLFDHDPAELPRLLELSAGLRPTALYNISGTLLKAIAELAERGGPDPAEVLSSYRAVVWAGEPLGRRARALAREWGIPLFEHSSVGDVTAAFECPAHDGMHVWEDTVLVEGIEPGASTPVDAAPLDDGVRCELVATALTNRVAPLVRFRSDDLVEIDRRRCSCGRTHLRVRTVGRTGDEVVVEGRSVLPLDLWDAIESVPACRLGLFQVVRPDREVDTLRLRVGYRDTPPSRRAALADEVAGAVHDALGLVPEVELVAEGDLLRLGPPHKIPRVARS